MGNESKITIAPSTAVHRVGDPTPAKTDLAGRAIQFPLSEAPDQEWRSHFGAWDRLGKYFAQIRFEGDMLLLFLGGSSTEGAIESGLDEVQHAIAKANESRQAEVEHDCEQAERATEQRAMESERVERALQTWSGKQTATGR